MGKATPRLGTVLSRLEARYGPQEADWPTDPYLFVLWWHCGYPASDERCAKGWQALNDEVGVTPEAILAIPSANLARALEAGGMVPDLRAARLKEIASRIEHDHGCDLRASLDGDIAEARKALKKFPGIADPGADRILLFADIAPLAAVPSNCPHVLVRIQQGSEGGSYGATYNQAQQAIARGTRPTFQARKRAYLLLRRHGQETCKHTHPKCDVCPVNSMCSYYASGQRVTAPGTARSGSGRS